MEPVLFVSQGSAHATVCVLDGIVVDLSFCLPGGVTAALLRRDFTDQTPMQRD